MRKNRERKPILKQTISKTAQDNNEAPKKKKSIRFKAAIAFLALLSAVMLSSCNAEMEDNHVFVSQTQQAPEFENGDWELYINGFESQQEAVDAKEIIGVEGSTILVSSRTKDGKQIWSISSTDYDIDNLHTIKELQNDNLKFDISGPYKNVLLYNLSAEELQDVYANIDINWGDITIKQKFNTDTMSIAYDVEFKYLCYADAEKVHSLLSTNTSRYKVQKDSDKTFAINKTKETIMAMFNLDGKEITAHYEDDYGEKESISTIITDLSNSNITKIVDYNGNEIITHTAESQNQLN